MAITYELITPTLIPNTTMEKVYLDGVHKIYRITPNEGYGLHDKDVDEVVFDEMGEPTDELIPRFGTGSRTVRADYDFTATTQGTYTYTDENGMEVSVPVTMIGPKEYYTLPLSVIPENNTYGGGTDHEIA